MAHNFRITIEKNADAFLWKWDWYIERVGTFGYLDHGFAWTEKGARRAAERGADRIIEDEAAYAARPRPTVYSYPKEKE